jgi:hypothetical protein
MSEHAVAGVGKRLTGIHGSLRSRDVHLVRGSCGGNKERERDAGPRRETPYLCNVM